MLGVGIRAYLFADFVAIHSRHRDIEQNEIGDPLFDLGEPVDAVNGTDDGVSRFFEFARNEFSNGSAIVDDENGFSLWHCIVNLALAADLVKTDSKCIQLSRQYDIIWIESCCF